MISLINKFATAISALTKYIPPQHKLVDIRFEHTSHSNKYDVIHVTAIYDDGNTNKYQLKNVYTSNNLIVSICMDKYISNAEKLSVLGNIKFPLVFDH